jgi:hypothetical protein
MVKMERKNVKIRKMAIRAKNENITDSNAIKIKYCGSSLM